jgi:hypothetical protein
MVWEKEEMHCHIIHKNMLLLSIFLYVSFSLPHSTSLPGTKYGLAADTTHSIIAETMPRKK